jgi:hypothetical protein
LVTRPDELAAAFARETGCRLLPPPPAEPPPAAPVREKEIPNERTGETTRVAIKRYADVVLTWRGDEDDARLRELDALLARLLD